MITNRTLRRIILLTTSWATVVALSTSLAGCSSAGTTIFGNWVDAHGHAAAVLDNGQCTGMYYANGSPLDIGGGMTCSYSNGTLVVAQAPNTITYKVALSTDTMTLTSGSQTITLNRLGSQATGTGNSSTSGDSSTQQAKRNEVTVSVKPANGDPTSSATLSGWTVLIEHRLDRAGVKYTSVTATKDGNLAVLLPDSASPGLVQKAAKILTADAGSGFHRVIASAGTTDSSGTSGSSPRLTQASYDALLKTPCEQTMVGPVSIGDGLEVVCDSNSKVRYLLSEVEIKGTSVATFAVSGSGVTLNLDADGTQRLSTLSQQLLGLQLPNNQLAFVSGDEVVFAPTINAAITAGMVQISGPDRKAALVDAELEFASKGSAVLVQSMSNR